MRLNNHNYLSLTSLPFRLYIYRLRKDLFSPSNFFLIIYFYILFEMNKLKIYENFLNINYKLLYVSFIKIKINYLSFKIQRLSKCLKLITSLDI